MSEVPVKAVKKALDLLSALIFDDPELRGVKLTVLAKKLGLPVNTTHNLLKTMAACGYVVQNESGRYRPGPQCRRIGLVNKVECVEFKQKLADVLRHYTAQINEAIVFAALHGGKRVAIAKSEPLSQVIRIDHQVVENCNIYRLPTGRILAAFATPADYRRIQDNYGAPGINWPNCETDLKRIRKEGSCLMLPDSSGVNSFAVPVMNKDGKLLGAIGCYAPPFRSGPSVQRKILGALRLAAEELALP